MERFEKEIIETRQAERLSEVRDVLKIITDRMVLPLYFLFWACDVIYVPEKKWLFLGIRCLTIPLCLVIRYFLDKVKTFNQGQALALTYTASLASTISLMIFILGDRTSPYYAGLNLVAVGSLAFVPWAPAFYALTVIAIYVPYLAVAFLTTGGWSNFLVNSFFMSSTVLIAFFIRFFNENLRLREIKSRLQLRDEIAQRDVVIKEKNPRGR